MGAPLQDPWSLLVHVGGQREVTASINYMGKTGWQPWGVSFRTRPGSEKGLPRRREQKGAVLGKACVQIKAKESL